MGLDQYLTGRKVIFTPYAANPRLEDGYPVEQIDIRLGYWRKHHNLHEYIVAGFAYRGEQTHEAIELNADDLTTIINTVDTLAASFEEQREYKETFTKALNWLKQGDPEPEFKPLQTDLGQTLSAVGLQVFEVDEGTFPVKDVRYILYRASW